MRNRNTGIYILLMIFLVLATIVYLQDQRSSDDSQAPIAAPAFSRVFPDLSVLDILAIQMSFPETDLIVTFARETSGQWIWLEEDQPISNDVGTSVARTVVLLPYTRTIPPPSDGDMTQYGFGETPQFLISVVTASNGELSVGIGDPLQTGPGFYGIVNDREQLYVLQRSPIDFLVSLVLEPPETSDPNGASITP